MASDPVQGAELRLRRLFHWFDPESAAVVTVLLGVLQLLLCPAFIYTSQSPPKLFILSVLVGVLIVAGGSLTIANERAPNRLLLRGCACTNVVCLGGALLSLCLYFYNLSSLNSQHYECPAHSSEDHDYHDYHSPYHRSQSLCLPEHLRAYSWTVTVLMLLCDTGAVLTHSLLCVSALRTLKHE